MDKKIKHQIPSTNDQNPNPLTLPSPPRGEGKGWLLEIGDWNLFEILDLEFGI
jgi:hypothetical protein